MQCTGTCELKCIGCEYISDMGPNTKDFSLNRKDKRHIVTHWRRSARVESTNWCFRVDSDKLCLYDYTSDYFYFWVGSSIQNLVTVKDIFSKQKGHKTANFETVRSVSVLLVHDYDTRNLHSRGGWPLYSSCRYMNEAKSYSLYSL